MVQVPLLRNRMNQLSVVVIPELSDENATLHYFVDDPMFRIDSARPVSTKGVFKRFWPTDTGMGIPDDVL